MARIYKRVKQTQSWHKNLGKGNKHTINIVNSSFIMIFYNKICYSCKYNIRWIIAINILSINDL